MADSSCDQRLPGAELSHESARATAHLPVFLDADAFSNVIREAQEIVELTLKGMLRQVGSAPPHWHDVGGLLREYALRFEAVAADDIDRLATASAWLRNEREFAFDGDVDVIPTEQYARGAAARAIADAEFAVRIAGRVIIVISSLSRPVDCGRPSTALSATTAPRRVSRALRRRL